jgi:hypothetical protein
LGHGQDLPQVYIKVASIYIDEIWKPCATNTVKKKKLSAVSIQLSATWNFVVLMAVAGGKDGGQRAVSIHDLSQGSQSAQRNNQSSII